MLRPAVSDDLPAVLAIWTRPETAMLLPPPEPGDAEAACDDGLLFVWERQGRVAGFASLAIWHRADGIWGLTHFAVANPGQGEGRHFLAALLDEVFERRGAHRLSVDSVPDNRPALRLWEWAGFRQEGCFRQCWRRPDGQWSDSLVFALLAAERPRAEALD